MTPDQAPPLEQLEARLAELRRGEPGPDLVDLLNDIGGHSGVSVERKLQLSQEGYALATRLDYSRGRARSLLELSKGNILKGRGEEALNAVLEAEEILKHVDDAALWAFAHYQFGSVYTYLGDQAEALSHLFDALNFYRAAGDRRGEANTLTVIGIVYQHMGQHDQAIEFFEQGLPLYRELQHEENQAVLLINRALSLSEHGDYERARTSIEAALAICRRLLRTSEHVRIYPYALNSMTDLLIRVGELDEAERYVNEARRENRMPEGSPRYGDLEAEMLQRLGRIYRLRGAFDEARMLLDESISISRRSGYRSAEMATLRELVTLCEAANDYQRGMQHFKRLYELEQEIFSEQSTQKIRNLQVRYATETTRREAQILQEKNAQLEQMVAELERTRSELQAALEEVQRRAAEQAALLAENERQRRTIHALNVPVLPLSDSVLVMPLVGELDDERLRQLREHALGAIYQAGARFLLIDITGVAMVDTQVAQGVLAVVQAARLLGTKVILVGIRPEVAQAIVGLGLDLEGVQTTANLQAALQLLGMAPQVAATPD